MRTVSATVRRSLRLAIVCGVLLKLGLAYAAPTDVCSLRGAAFNDKVTKGATEIANAYAATKSQLSLSGDACDWTCGSPRLITPLVKAFGFLQYNCHATTVPPSTRLATGKGTDSEMGLSVTDKDYRTAADKIFRSGSTAVGDLMRVPPSVESASRSGKVLDVIQAVEALPGATWTLFRSTSVNNDGEGFDRIIIQVPDAQAKPRFEQWIQIAINDSTGDLGRNVDFIAVQLQSDSASPLTDGHPIVVFRGFSRRSTGFKLEGPGGDGDLSKCYSCHPSGLRPVVPAKGLRTSVPKGKTPTIPAADITDLTSTRANFGPTGYTASENGPPFGPASRPDRLQFVAKSCAAGLSEARQKEIADRMNCEQCHNGSFKPMDRGILNASTNLGTIRHKVVENKLAPMPPGVTDPGGLKDSERATLFECLQAEYAEILREWLTSDLLMVP